MPPDLAPRIGLDGYYAGPPSACGKERPPVSLCTISCSHSFLHDRSTADALLHKAHSTFPLYRPFPPGGEYVLRNCALWTKDTGVLDLSFQITPVLLPISSPIIRLVLSILDSKTAFVRLILSHRTQLCLLCYLFYIVLLFPFSPSTFFSLFLFIVFGHIQSYLIAKLHS
jgi:hypothetical protein